MQKRLIFLTMASLTPHPSPQMGPQGPFSSSWTSTRPKKKNTFIKHQRLPWKNHSSFLTFLKIPASKKSDFQSMSMGLVNFNGRSGCSGGGWRRSGWWLRLTLDSCRFCSFAIMDSPAVESEIQLYAFSHWHTVSKSRFLDQKVTFVIVWFTWEVREKWEGKYGFFAKLLKTNLNTSH